MEDAQASTTARACSQCETDCLDGCPFDRCAMELCVAAENEKCQCDAHLNMNRFRRSSILSDAYVGCKCSAPSKPKRIILVRHEESLGNIDESAYTRIPDWKIPITERGIQHGQEHTAEAVKRIVGEDPVYFYTSPYIRTKHTCRLIMEKFNDAKIVGIREEPRIVEQQFGNFQNTSIMGKAKAERWKFGSFFYRFPNGESGLDVYNRAADFISTLFRDFVNPHIARENLNIIVVTHGLTMRLFLMRWFQYSVEEFENTKNPENGGIAVMERHEHRGESWFELTPDSLERLQFPQAAQPYSNELTQLKPGKPRASKKRFWARR